MSKLSDDVKAIHVARGPELDRLAWERFAMERGTFDDDEAFRSRLERMAIYCATSDQVHPVKTPEPTTQELWLQLREAYTGSVRRLEPMPSRIVSTPRAGEDMVRQLVDTLVPGDCAEIVFGVGPTRESLEQRAADGRERMIQATLDMWAEGGGAMTRPFAERYVDGLANKVGQFVATHLAVCAGWETKADRAPLRTNTVVGTGPAWTLVCEVEK